MVVRGMNSGNLGAKRATTASVDKGVFNTKKKNEEYYGGKDFKVHGEVGDDNDGVAGNIGYDDDVCRCEIVSDSPSKSDMGDAFDLELPGVQTYDVSSKHAEKEIVEGGKAGIARRESKAGKDIKATKDIKESKGKFSPGKPSPKPNNDGIIDKKRVASAFAKTGSDHLNIGDVILPGPHDGYDDTNDQDSTPSDFVDASDLTTMKLAEEMRSRQDDVGSEDGKTSDEVISLLGQDSPKSGRIITSRKLKWVPKASVPAYLINVANKLNVGDMEHVSITTRGQGAKLAAEKIEKMASKIKQGKQKLKEESNQSRLSAQQSRAQVVAAEKARVNGAKKAREMEAERIRMEAAERRRVEANLKERMKTEFETKKDLLNKARKAVIQRGRADLA